MVATLGWTYPACWGGKGKILSNVGGGGGVKRRSRHFKGKRKFPAASEGTAGKKGMLQHRGESKSSAEAEVRGKLLEGGTASNKWRRMKGGGEGKDSISPYERRGGQLNLSQASFRTTRSSKKKKGGETRPRMRWEKKRKIEWG